MIVRGVPPWVPIARLLDDGPWAAGPDGLTAERSPAEAADLQARLRALVLGGSAVEVDVIPPLPRPLVRSARTDDARRRRDTTPGFTRREARLDEEGRYSLTPEALASALGKRARGRSVVDAFAGCGGNAIGFARSGSAVVAIERDPVRAELLRHNLRVYGVADRVTVRVGDALELLPSLEAELLFLDPPWADPELPLLGMALEASRGRFAETWAKVPPGFDPARVPGAAAEAWFGAADGDRRRVKFVLLKV